MIIEKKQVEEKPLTVVIEYPQWNDSVENLVRKISLMDLTFTGKSKDRTVNISISDIYYIENV